MLALSTSLGLALVALPLQPADSLALHREARSAQERFERIRAQEAPSTWWTGGSACDEIVGRICIRFSGDDDGPDAETRWIAEPDPPRTREARQELLNTLAAVAEELPGDRWVVGQRVAYLGESGGWDDALSAAAACRAEGWWCDALEGYALHHLGRLSEAEERFREALAAMPPGERQRWTEVEWLVELDVLRHLREGESPEELDRRLEGFWRLADPLYLLPGNPLRSEHLARHTLARIRDGARNAHALRWGDDLAELLVRYGEVVTYQRTRDMGPGRGMSPPSVVGHFPPEARSLLPPAQAVEAPGRSRPSDWRTDLRRARSRHAIPGVPRIRSLDAQVTAFRRGDSLHVAVRWALPDRLESAPPPTYGPWEPDPSPRPAYPPSNPETGLFLLPLAVSDAAGGPTGAPPAGPGETVLLGERHGVSVLTAPTGSHLLSMEVLDRAGGRAWRLREGLSMRAPVRGVVELSDLLLARPEGDDGRPALTPRALATLDRSPELATLLTRSLPRDEVGRDPVEVAWEVYGLTGREGTVAYHLTVRPAEQGLLTRAGRFLRILPREDRLEVRWEEGAEPSPTLRSVTLNLSSLPAGPLRVTLALSLPGRTPALTEKVIELRR